MSYCKVIIVGNLGDDPKTTHFDNGGQLTNLSVATSENWKDKETGEKKSRTEWNRVVLNGKLSELADNYLNKGSKVLIEGRLRTRKWTDNNQVDRYTTEIQATNMTFLDSKSDSNESQGSAVENYLNKKIDTKKHNDDKAITEDDLPF